MQHSLPAIALRATPHPWPPPLPPPLPFTQAVSLFALLTYGLHRINRALRSQVALKGDRRPRGPLLGVAAAAALLAAAALPASSQVFTASGGGGGGVAGNLVLAGGAHPTRVRCCSVHLACLCFWVDGWPPEACT